MNTRKRKYTEVAPVKNNEIIKALKLELEREKLQIAACSDAIINNCLLNIEHYLQQAALDETRLLIASNAVTITPSQQRPLEQYAEKERQTFVKAILANSVIIKPSQTRPIQIDTVTANVEPCVAEQVCKRK